MHTPHFTLYAWRISWYSAKVRSYLQHKGIRFTEKKPSLLMFKRTIPQHCGDAAVPVLVTPEGQWLQDSTLIIEAMEQRYPKAPALPATPVQRCFALLVELWADEFWHPTAEHYRFSFHENFPLWRDELSTLLPGFPRFMRHAVVNHFHQFMLEVTRQVGVVPNTHGLVERWSERQLDALDAHFAAMPYLLGSRASLADFALMGPINGHLALDPYPLRQLIDRRQHLRGWIARMSATGQSAGAFLPDDQLPASLDPMLASLFGEMLPYLEQCTHAMRALEPMSATDPRYPRLGPAVDIPYGGASLRRVVVPYALWMLQRLQDQVAQSPEAQATQVKDWLAAHGAAGLLSLRFPRLRRVGLHVAPEVALGE